MRNKILVLTAFMALVNSAVASDVVINEIIQNPSAVSDANGEWFEVHNPTASAIDIDGWTIRQRYRQPCDQQWRTA